MPEPSLQPATAVGRPWVRTALWLLLGGWFGSYLLFGAVIAPTAFAVLPSTEIAGTLVAPVLTRLHLFGAMAGVPLALLSMALRRSKPLVALPVALSALCLYSHFGVSIELDEIRDLAFGPQGSAEMAARFHHLHRLSVAVFVTVGLAVTALIAMHAHADARTLSPPGKLPNEHPGRAAGEIS